MGVTCGFLVGAVISISIGSAQIQACQSAEASCWTDPKCKGIYSESGCFESGNKGCAAVTYQPERDWCDACACSKTTGGAVGVVLGITFLCCCCCCACGIVPCCCFAVTDRSRTDYERAELMDAEEQNSFSIEEDELMNIDSGVNLGDLASHRADE